MRSDENEIVRHGLVESLRAVVRRPLTVLRAPAGYGKSTVVRQASAHWRGEGFSVVGLLGQARRGTPTVVVLDHLHELDEEEWERAVSTALATLEPSQHVVLILRRPPPPAILAVARTLEHETLTKEHLRFSVHECAELLRATCSADRAAALGQYLHGMTGGWPAAMASAAVDAVAAHQPKALLRAPHAGWERFVLERVLDRQPPGVCAFLKASALMGGANQNLCDAVLERSDSAGVIARLLVEELVSPVAGHDGWFAHHPALAEALRSRARRDEPIWSEMIHKRATSWLLAHGQVERALAQSLAVEDHAQAARILLASRVALPAAGVAPALSARELEVLGHLTAGLKNKEIAQGLFISVSTVKAHVQRVFRKVGATSRTEAIARARRLGLT